jgi:undecaprenyl-diphosphatase
LNLWEGIVLAIVQGLTEFLPVSSSGHLVIAQSLFNGFEQPGVLFDVMLHFGTLMAVAFFLRREIIAILKTLTPRAWIGPDGKSEENIAGRKMALAVVMATIVTGIIGIAFEERIHALFQSVRTVSFMLVITGLLLFISDRVRKGEREEREITVLDGLLVGLVQGMALIPGISRSGSTIAMGIFRGLKGETAARFSFLVSMPAVLGATILELKYAAMVPAPTMLIYCISMVVAGITGFLTLEVLLFIISKRKLSAFAYYCWALALVTFFVTVT